MVIWVNPLPEPGRWWLAIHGAKGGDWLRKRVSLSLVHSGTQCSVQWASCRQAVHTWNLAGNWWLTTKRKLMQYIGQIVISHLPPLWRKILSIKIFILRLQKVWLVIIYCKSRCWRMKCGKEWVINLGIGNRKAYPNLTIIQYNFCLSIWCWTNWWLEKLFEYFHVYTDE